MSFSKSQLPKGIPQSGPPGKARLITDRFERPDLDDRQYRVIELANKMEVFLAHDPKADKAGASMDVDVGSFSDEEDMPGIAHAVEHALFMGTKKYPGENDYSQYLSSNSGDSNAYTLSTSTNYYFNVSAKPVNDKKPSELNPSPLLGALDRFSQFFVEPLFLESTLDRELKAVESENKKNLRSDNWRLSQLDKSLSNPDHPFCNFSTGNLEVLKTFPEKAGINVRDKFIEFYQKHYSANRMKLCVLGLEPLELLEKWVVELFTPVLNKDLPRNHWDTEVPLRPADLGIQCFAKPVMDLRQVNLAFPVPNEEEMYRSQPSCYIRHLIGHEGPGSILSYIKAKGWANGLYVDMDPICPGSPGILECQINLTEEGLKHYEEVVKVFFQYVAFLQETLPQQWIFEEQKGLSDIAFKFKQKTSVNYFTTSNSSLMQEPIPREWLLSDLGRLRDFDPKAIKKTLDCLRTDNFRMTIVSQRVPGDWDQKEKWYGTEYKVEKIPTYLMDELRQAEASAPENRQALHLPHKNKFIPTNFEVEKKEVEEPAVAPAVIRNDDSARTWWKKDDMFWVPETNLNICCRNPLIFASVENAVKANLYVALVRDAFKEISYNAALAGVGYGVDIDSQGLLFKLSGYNHKLPELLEHVLKATRDLEIKDDRFDIIKESQTRGWATNWELQKPFNHIHSFLGWLNSERSYLVSEYAAALHNITVESLRQYKSQLLGQLHFELLVHGNVHEEDALRLTDIVQSVLAPRPLPQTQWPIKRSLVIPPGGNYVYKKTLKDPDNVNHCIEYWLYTGDRGDPLTRARTLLLVQLMQEPAFDKLRTKEQLGYVASCDVREFATTCGFRFLVQSEKDPAYLESRINAFIESFMETLKNMGEKDFEEYKRSLVVRLLKKPENLSKETDRYWVQITGGYYNFRSSQEDAEVVRGISKSEIEEFYRTKIHTASIERAKLAVQLFARGSLRLDELNSTAEGYNPTIIEDVRKYKAGLVASAGPKPARDVIGYED